MAKGNGGTRSGNASNPKGLLMTTKASEKIPVKINIDDYSNDVGVFNVKNGIDVNLEITKTDIRHLIYETGKDSTLSEKKIELAHQIKDFVENGEYIGWAEPDEGTHAETAYFAYYSKKSGERYYLSLRYMKKTRNYKPYVFYSEDGFKERINKIKNGIPTM